MGTARSVFFTVSSILMILAGAGGIAEQVMIVLERSGSPGVSVVLTYLCAVFALISCILNIISGISGVRCYNRRINSAVTVRLPEISVFLCLISLVLSFFNGIIFGFLIAQFVTGILIPAIFIYAAVKKSYYDG